MDDSGCVKGLEGGERVVEDDQRGRRGEASGHIDQVAQRDPVDPFVDDRRLAVIEVDDGKEMLVAQGAEHAHVVADLTAERGVGGQRRAEQPDDHARSGGVVVGVEERTGAVDADPPIQYVAGNMCPRPGDVVASSLVHSPSVCRHKSAVASNSVTETTSIGH